MLVRRPARSELGGRYVQAWGESDWKPVGLQAAMKCVAWAARPHAGLHSAPWERCARGSTQARGQNSVANRRQVEKSRGGTDGRVPGTSYCGELVCRGACREFSDYDFEGSGGPSGRARLRCRTDALRQHPDVKRIGLDRPDAPVGSARTKARNFADAFVLRDDRGWCITDSGRQFLATLETPTPARVEEKEQPSGPGVMVVTAPSRAQPTLRLVVDNTRASQSDLGPDETRRSA